MTQKIRPYTTLFMLMSLDGKISSGASDDFDVDSDWKRINGVREGLFQYYDLEQETDLFSLNSGRTWAKIGFNKKKDEPDKTPVTFVVIDNKPHLSPSGIEYAAKKARKLIVVTTNPHSPAIEMKTKHQNISILQYHRTINFSDMMEKLKTDFDADHLTIQTGGTLNAEFLRAGLVDRILIVIAPLLVGGQTTPSLVSGEPIATLTELNQLTVLTLVSCKQLKNSFLQLEYSVQPETHVT